MPDATLNVSPLPIGRPMYQMDAQHTGRSPHIGPRQLMLLRTFNTRAIDVPDPIFGIDRHPELGGDRARRHGLYRPAQRHRRSLCAIRSAPATSSPRAGASIRRRLVLARHPGASRATARSTSASARTTARPMRRARCMRSRRQRRASSRVSCGRSIWARAARRRRRSSARTAPSTRSAANGRLSAISPDGQVRWTAQTGPVLKSSVGARRRTARSTCRA